ncbi:MAG: hypothetical protein M0P73_12635 [Syntrophobacterales bacterium]|jgi:hypothetical protein|nr:hypothetical protein [Syntrophobacterales bacterium]
MKRLLTPACLMLLCLLVLAEAGARVFFAKDISGRFDYGYNPEAGFAEHADGTVELFRAGGRRFYPQTFKRGRPPGVFRIMTVGDSVPRGPSLKGAYPGLLGQELRQHGIPAESINLAVPGYGARRCQIVLRQAVQYEPSLIILHFDDYNKWEDEREWRRSQEFKGWHPRHWLMKVFIFRRLYEAKMEKVFWALVPEEVRLRYAVNDADAQVAAGADPKEVAARIKLAYDTAVENVAMVRKLQIPVILVTQCRLEEDARHRLCLTDHGLDKLGESLKGPGVYHVSMKKVLSGQDIKSIFLNFSGHLHQAGHQLLANAIFEKIEAEQAALGLPEPTVAVAGKTPQARTPAPQKP